MAIQHKAQNLQHSHGIIHFTVTGNWIPWFYDVPWKHSSIWFHLVVPTFSRIMESLSHLGHKALHQNHGIVHFIGQLLWFYDHAPWKIMSMRLNLLAFQTNFFQNHGIAKWPRAWNLKFTPESWNYPFHVQLGWFFSEVQYKTSSVQFNFVKFIPSQLFSRIMES